MLVTFSRCSLVLPTKHRGFFFCVKLRTVSFLPHPFQFTSHPIIRRCVLWATESLINIFSPVVSVQVWETKRGFHVSLFCVTSSCSLAGRYWRFGGTWCLHFQLELRSWRQYIPPKRSALTYQTASRHGPEHCRGNRRPHRRALGIARGCLSTRWGPLALWRLPRLVAAWTRTLWRETRFGPSQSAWPSYGCPTWGWTREWCSDSLRCPPSPTQDGQYNYQCHKKTPCCPLLALPRWKVVSTFTSAIRKHHAVLSQHYPDAIWSVSLPAHWQTPFRSYLPSFNFGKTDKIFAKFGMSVVTVLWQSLPTRFCEYGSDNSDSI